MRAFPVPFSSNLPYLIAALPLVPAIGFGVGGVMSGRWYVSAAAILAAVISAVLFSWANSLRNISLEVSDGKLVFNIPRHHREIPFTAIKRADVRRVDLAREPQLRPAERTDGADIAGIRQGWFKLANGEKAFVALTSDDAVLVPTTDGYAVLVSPSDPQGFVDALK